MEMINGTGEYGLLLGLPDEIWEKILNLKRMTPLDISNFRCVNKKSKALTDSFFNRWIIKLDDRYEHDENKGPYLETLLDLRVEKVRVSHFLEPLSFCPPGVVFKFPDLLKRVNVYFGNDEGCDVSISAENLHFLLKSRNLEDLTLNLVEANINSPVYSSQPPLIGYDFSKLKTLFIQFYYNEEEKQLILIKGNLLDRILKGSVYENLYSVDFILQIGGNESLAAAYQMSCDMLNFFVKYGHVLTSIQFEATLFEEDSPEELPDSLESLHEYRLNNCSNLDTLIVNCDFLHDAWIALTKVQRKLATLWLKGMPVSVDLLRAVIDRNYLNLNDIRLPDLEVDLDMADRHFDFSIFSNCQKLRSLNLNSEPSEDVPEGRNLFAIHQNLQVLEINFLLSSADLILFCSNHMKLESFTLSDAGTLGDFGVNGSVLESLLALTELRDIYIHESSINVSNPAESVKLLSVLHSLDVNFNRVDGQCIFLRRDPTTNLWDQL